MLILTFPVRVKVQAYPSTHLLVGVPTDLPEKNLPFHLDGSLLSLALDQCGRATFAPSVCVCIQCNSTVTFWKNACA